MRYESSYECSTDALRFDKQGRCEASKGYFIPNQVKIHAYCYYVKIVWKFDLEINHRIVNRSVLK